MVIGFWIVTALFCLQIGFTAYAQLRFPQDEVPVIVRVDPPIEVEHYKGGGILQYVLRRTLSRA
jgi:aconitase A